MSEKYKHYICFGGADIAIFIDNQAYGEIDDIYINTKTKELTIKTVIFNTLVDTLKEFTSTNNSKVLIVFCNEYGYKMYRVFNGVKFSHEDIQYSTTAMLMHNSFVFTFEDSTPYENFSTIDELRKEIFNV